MTETLTRESVLAADERELDAIAGEVFDMKFNRAWWAMDGKEEGIFIGFDSQAEAQKWHDEHYKKYPYGNYQEQGGHIVEKKIYPHFSTDLNAAALLRAEIVRRDLDMRFIDELELLMDIKKINPWLAKGQVFSLINASAKLHTQAAILAALETENKL